MGHTAGHIMVHRHIIKHTSGHEAHSRAWGTQQGMGHTAVHIVGHGTHSGAWGIQWAMGHTAGHGTHRRVQLQFPLHVE